MPTPAHLAQYLPPSTYEGEVLLVSGADHPLGGDSPWRNERE